MFFLRNEVNEILEDGLADLEDLFGNKEELLASLERLFNSLGVAVTDSLKGRHDYVLEEVGAPVFLGGLSLFGSDFQSFGEDVFDRTFDCSVVGVAVNVDHFDR